MLPASWTPKHLISLGTSLSDAGLLTDGASLWFSMIYRPISSSNSSITISLGDEETALNAVGLTISGTSTGYRVVTEGSVNTNLAANTALNMLQPQLIVGQLIWGANGADDQYYIYFPDSELNLGSASRSAAAFNVDQTSFNSFMFDFYNVAGEVDEIRIGASYEAVIGGELDTSDDVTPPSPSQMTWASAPAADSETSISMTATTATDENGVEYRFLETSGQPGGTSSDWQLSTSYTDTGLDPDTTYSYTVQARDRSVNFNTNTVSSPPAEATTLPVDVTAPPTPSFITPFSVTSSTVSLEANAVTDPEGKDVEYRFNNVTSGTNSGWLTSPSYLATGLSPETTYSFTVEARDSALTPNVSAPSSAEFATTGAAIAALTEISTVAAGNNALISVAPGQFQGFSANTGTVDTAFNNPVLDYGFYGWNSSYGDSLGGSSRISPLTNAGSGNDYTDYWITSDPLTEVADQTESGSRTNGSAGGLTSGMIDISGLTNGSVYIFHGRWQNGAVDHLEVVMSGAGQTDVTLPTAGATVNGGPIIWATRIDFSDAADYDTITFTHYVNDGASGGYMSGVVLTQAVTETDPYDTWSGGEAMESDKNGDGISNGMAFLLGATDPVVDAMERMPVVGVSSGGLTLGFTCLKAEGRGSLIFNLEYSSDLGQTDPWSLNQVEIPGDVSNVTINDVVFEVTENGSDSSMVDVVAAVPTSKASEGKLFVRLSASE